jgi:hypothetical protein
MLHRINAGPWLLNTVMVLVLWGVVFWAGGLISARAVVQALLSMVR